MRNLKVILKLEQYTGEHEDFFLFFGHLNNLIQYFYRYSVTDIFLNRFKLKLLCKVSN